MRPAVGLVVPVAVCVSLQGQQRRQARSGGSVRGATEMDICGLRIYQPPPPHPPTMENRPGWGQTGRPGGWAIAFINHGGRGVFLKPVDNPPQHPANPHGSKQKCPTGFFQNPRVVPFCPRVWSFYPRVCFRRFAAPPLSISLFSLRKESEREDSGRQARSTGYFLDERPLPRNCYLFGSYSVDGKGNPGTLSPYKSTTWAFPPVFPRSTDKNAYTPHGVGSQ